MQTLEPRKDGAHVMKAFGLLVDFVVQTVAVTLMLALWVTGIIIPRDTQHAGIVLTPENLCYR